MTPALEVIKRAENWKIAVLVEEPWDQILLEHPFVDRLLTIPRRHNQWLFRCRAVAWIRALAPNTVVDLHGGTTSALITYFSSASRRVGYGDGRNTRFYNVHVPDSRTVWNRKQVHTVEHQMTPLKFLGFPVEPFPPLRISIDDKVKEAARQLLLAHGIQNGFVMIHPGAAFDTKRWETQKFVSLARRLSGLGWDVVFACGPGEEPLLREIHTSVPGVVKFLGALPLRLFCGVVSHCLLYIGNDTGSTHIASALGRKVVAIFGSSNSTAWRPWEVEHRLLQSDLPCIPCPGYYCLHFQEPKCIRSIEVDTVFQAAVSLL